jgi:hypothetical protein
MNVFVVVERVETLIDFDTEFIPEIVSIHATREGAEDVMWGKIDKIISPLFDGDDPLFSTERGFIEINEFSVRE